jgi:sec-independent protein translocase protein TatB
MQMFGIGILELIVILLVAAVVIGPDRIPGFASDLARWIRRTRAYAQRMMVDFNDVVADIEKEAGTSREDWKEIAGLVTRHTGDLGRQLESVGATLERSTQIDLEQAKADPGYSASNGASYEPHGTNGDQPLAEETEVATPVEQPWYVPEPTNRRRRPDRR